MLGISSEVTGFESVVEAMAAIAARADNLAPASRGVMLLIQEDVDERYQSAPPVRSGGVVYGGVMWPALSAAYLVANTRREGGKIGLDTGRSRQSFTIGGSGNVARGGRNEIEFGSNRPEVRGFHKRRPLIFQHAELVDSVNAYLTDWILNGNT